MSPRVIAAAALLTGAMVLTACGTGSTTTVTKTTTVVSTSIASTSSSGSSTTAQPKVENLVVDRTLRRQLLAAGAAMHQLPSSDYTGLVKGLTYYAYDPATGAYWAGAGLMASASSLKAQVGDQDDGAFLDFERPAGGAWRAYPAGIPGNSNYSCAVTIPPAVLAVWGWPSGTCHPPA
jgi:hypothetical protein